MDSFSKALGQFANLNPDTAIDRLHVLFSEISEMSIEEIIAAKHTLDTYKDSANLNEGQQKLLEALIKAVCRRAQGILAKETKGSFLVSQTWDQLEGTFTKEQLGSYEE